MTTPRACGRTRSSPRLRACGDAPHAAAYDAQAASRRLQRYQLTDDRILADARPLRRAGVYEQLGLRVDEARVPEASFAVVGGGVARLARDGPCRRLRGRRYLACDVRRRARAGLAGSVGAAEDGVPL